MVTITIEPADNGLVKFLIDDNINGGGEEHVARRVYDFDCSTGRHNQVKFVNDLILDLGHKKVIADTKYKIVYSDDTDPKKGISQSDLYQMLAYAVRFEIQEIKLFYPNTVATEAATGFTSIEIKDKLAEDKQISITAHQLPVIDKSITVATLLKHDKLLNCFEGLKEDLKIKLFTILNL